MNPFSFALPLLSVPMHRLPSRRASALAQESTSRAVSPDRASDTTVTDDVPLLVTPELITELVQNGSIASHFRGLVQPLESIGWASRRHIETEMEVGSSLATTPIPNQPSESRCRAEASGLPLLLRAFRRPSSTSSLSTSPLQLHCLTEPQSLEQWAPVNKRLLSQTLRIQPLQSCMWSEPSFPVRCRLEDHGCSSNACDRNPLL